MATNYTDMLEELKSAYSNLLIAQYHQGVNSVATIKANIETLLSNMLLWKIRDCWDIDDTTLCVGTQLDIIGKWVGVDRYFVGQSFGDSLHLSFVDWNEVLEPTVNQGGLRDWNVDRPEDGDFLTYDNVISVTNKLNDDDFRLLIKLKIIKNNTIMNCKNIDDAINDVFGINVLTSWNNVNELDYFVGNDSLYAIIELAKLKNCLPIPTGCKIALSQDLVMDGGSSSITGSMIIDGGNSTSLYTSNQIINGGLS